MNTCHLSHIRQDNHSLSYKQSSVFIVFLKSPPLHYIRNTDMTSLHRTQTVTLSVPTTMSTVNTPVNTLYRRRTETDINSIAQIAGPTNPTNDASSLYYRDSKLLDISASWFATQTLLRLQRELDIHLSPQTLSGLLTMMSRSKFAERILMAICKLLGTPHPTLMQCHRILSRDNVLDDIKQLHTKVISPNKKFQISVWMTVERATFDPHLGYRGYKPLQVLKDWALFVVRHSAQSPDQHEQLQNKGIPNKLGRRSVGRRSVGRRSMGRRSMGRVSMERSSVDKQGKQQKRVKPKSAKLTRKLQRWLSPTSQLSRRLAQSTQSTPGREGRMFPSPTIERSPSALPPFRSSAVCSELIGADEQAANDMLHQSKAIKLLLDEKEKRRAEMYIERFSGQMDLHTILGLIQRKNQMIRIDRQVSKELKEKPKLSFRRKCAMRLKKLFCGAQADWLRD